MGDDSTGALAGLAPGTDNFLQPKRATVENPSMDQTSKENAKELLQRALDIYKAHHRTLILTGAMALVPLAVFNAVIHAWIFAPGLGLIGMLRTAFFAIFFLLLPAALIANLLGQGAVLVQLDALLTRRKLMDQASTWRWMMGRFAPLLSSSLFIAVGTAIGLLLFVVPGIWFLYRCMLVVPVTLFEQKSGWAAVVRSSQLVKASKDEAIAVLMGTGMIYFAVQIVTEMLLPHSISNVAADLLRVVLMPLPMIGLGLFYRHATAQDPSLPISD